MGAVKQGAISVVIPTYNRAALLPRAITSVQTQSVPVHEIIVVDDGSTDETPEVLASLARREPRLRLLQRSRGGANRARNAGVEHASGEWIAFLDSDDHWHPDKLEKQMLALSKRTSIAAFTGMVMHAPTSTAVYVPRRAPSLMDLRCSNVLSSTSSAVVSAEKLREVGGFDPELPSCQDWDLWFRLRQVGPFVIVREPLVHIDAGPHPRITTNLPKVMEGHRLLFARLREGLDSGAELRRVDAAHQLVMAELDRRAGNYGQALPNALTSCVRSPTLWAVRSITQSITGAVRQAVTGP